jgi:hypothetical protein
VVERKDLGLPGYRTMIHSVIRRHLTRGLTEKCNNCATVYRGRDLRCRISGEASGAVLEGLRKTKNPRAPDRRRLAPHLPYHVQRNGGA